MGRLGWTALAVTVALLVGAVALLVAPRSEPLPAFARLGPGEVGLWVILCCGFAVLGALICTRHARNPLGPLCALIAVTGGLAAFSLAYAIRALVVAPGSLPAGEMMAWLTSWIAIATLPLAGTVLPLLLPDGRLPSPRWRPVLWAAVVAIPATSLAFALAEGPLAEFPPLDNPVGVLPAASTWVGIAVPVLIPVCLASLVVRFRAAEGDQRQQLRWAAAAGGVFILAIAAEVAVERIRGEAGESLIITQLGFVVMLAAVGVAIMRYRLYDLDLVVNRALVYGVLTALVAGGYVGVVVGLGALLDRGGIGLSLLATGAVAVGVLPLRARLQRWVNRLMYGDRDDPYRALSRLGGRLGGALDPDEVMPTVVAAIAEGLRLPHVAIALRQDDRFVVVAQHGEPRGGAPVELPLEYRGEVVGRLVAGRRSASEPLSSADARLLADLARQAGVAAHAVALTADLRRSRERVVAAREEERRRLRRDLHDGLGPTLAGVALQLGSVQTLMGRDADAARALLRELTGQVQTAIADIRRIAHDLRPPSLDDLGLMGAVRAHAVRLGAGEGAAHATRFEVEGPEALPPLAAAVELAAYRIALEAMTNVARHAGARRCDVRIGLGAALELQVLDDGAGLPASRRSGGVGLASMRERAEELGGRLELKTGQPGGTVVRAVLPLEAP